jgi:succinate dehydrogenase / fumarate reductase cytochrome b subunit
MSFRAKLFLPFPSVIRKLLMSISGLFLVSFLLVHISGNLLLFVDDGGIAYDQYSHFMASNPLIKSIEWLLAAGFILHIAYGVWLSYLGRRSRGATYQVNRAWQNSSWSSRTMIWTGIWILMFLVIHLKTFWYPIRFNPAHPSPYGLVQVTFEGLFYSGFYVVSMFVLMTHLNHGFQSSFQSMGLRHPTYTPWVRGLGVVFWLVIPVLFAAIPVFFYLNRS